MLRVKTPRSKAMKTKREKEATLFCNVESLFPILLFLTLTYSCIKVARDSSEYKLSSNWALPVGVLTMLSGFVFLILGIPILAKLCLNLSANFQEEAAVYKATVRGTVSRVIQLFVVVIVMFMLWWIVYTGFSLATEPRRDYRYYSLTISVGVVAIIFGFLYSIIGIAICLEVGLDLLGQMRGRNTKKPLIVC